MDNEHLNGWWRRSSLCDLMLSRLYASGHLLFSYIQGYFILLETFSRSRHLYTVTENSENSTEIKIRIAAGNRCYFCKKYKSQNVKNSN
jgi:hypothetical protein